MIYMASLCCGFGRLLCFSVSPTPIVADTGIAKGDHHPSMVTLSLAVPTDSGSGCYPLLRGTGVPTHPHLLRNMCWPPEWKGRRGRAPSGEWEGSHCSSAPQLIIYFC